MSTAVKNEYAVDHTDVSSFKEFKDKYLPKNATDRFEWMREQHAAAIQELNEKHANEIKREEATIEFLRRKITEFENGQAFEEQVRKVKYEKGLNKALTHGHEEELKKKDANILRNSLEIEKLTTKLNNCVSNFRQLEKENNDLTENVRRLEKEKEDLKTSCEKQKNDLRTYCQERMQSLERENKQLSQIRENESRKQNNDIKYLMEEMVKMALEVKEYKLENDKLKKKVDAPITTSESRMPYLFGSISKDRRVV